MAESWSKKSNKGHSSAIIAGKLKCLRYDLKKWHISISKIKHPIHAGCIKERRELRRDLSEEEFNPTSKTRSTYNSATSACQADRLNSHNLVDQDRAHCLRLHGKLLNLEGLRNLLVPRWQSVSESPQEIKGPEEPLKSRQTCNTKSTQVVH